MNQACLAKRPPCSSPKPIPIPRRIATTSDRTAARAETMRPARGPGGPRPQARRHHGVMCTGGSPEGDRGNRQDRRCSARQNAPDSWGGLEVDRTSLSDKAGDRARTGNIQLGSRPKQLAEILRNPRVFNTLARSDDFRKTSPASAFFRILWGYYPRAGVRYPLRFRSVATRQLDRSGRRFC